MRFEESDAKRALLEQLLGDGMVLATIDARGDGVSVPPHLRGDSQLRLNLSYRFGLPMELDDWGINAALTFGGTPYTCEVPWPSIYMLVSHASGQPYLFPSDVPTDAEGNLAGALGIKDDPKPPETVERPRLTVISREEAAQESVEEPVGGDDEPPKKSPPRRGHLRVVK